jgi:photosystem II oxygen-evolving enhancer protein 1
MRFRSIIVAFLSLCLGILSLLNCGSALAVDKSQLTYDEIIGTGLANACPAISSFTRGTIAVEANSTYTIADLCLEPQQFFVKEEPLNKRQSAEFVQGKLLTRYTTSLEQIRGSVLVSNDGVLTFKEKDGGVYTGYDNAVALPASADSKELQRTNVKQTPIGKGTLSLQVTQVDGETGEIGGIFESIQPSDTDLGAKEPVDVKVRGIFYAKVES